MTNTGVVDEPNSVSMRQYMKSGSNNGFITVHMVPFTQCDRVIFRRFRSSAAQAGISRFEISENSNI